MKWWLVAMLATGCDQTFGFEQVPLPSDGSAAMRDGATDATSPGTWASIAAGEDHACGVTATGALYCFGNSVAGGNSPVTPVAMDPSKVFSHVVSAGSHSCALSSGIAYCWGHEVAYEITGRTSGIDYPSPQPVAIADPSAVIDLTTGVQHSCALLANGHVWCWGGGQELDGSSGIAQITGVPVGIRKLSAGLDHTCAMTSTSIVCWGDNGQSQCTGDGTSNVMIGPTPVNLTGTPIAVAAGREMTCAIMASAGSTAFECWGKDMFNSATKLVRPFSTDSGWSGVILGDRVVCGLKTDGAHCFGNTMMNGFGRSDVMLVSPNTTPVAIAGDQISLSLGAYANTDNEHACAVTNGHVTCWGPTLPTGVPDPM